MNIIIGHSNTDLDCLASMITAQKLYPGYEMVLSNLLNPLTGNVVSFYITKLSFKRPDDLKDQQIENIFVVDTRSSMRVKEFFANIGHV
ncbi:MAG: polynucleotide adenylyltransferase, partial [Spirochaetia bacterium]|nr:polynucleotide adenylyltransferase [Spirochaetia bacterium]